VSGRVRSQFGQRVQDFLCAGSAQRAGQERHPSCAPRVAAPRAEPWRTPALPPSELGALLLQPARSRQGACQPRRAACHQGSQVFIKSPETPFTMLFGAGQACAAKSFVQLMHWAASPDAFFGPPSLLHARWALGMAVFFAHLGAEHFLRPCAAAVRRRLSGGADVQGWRAAIGRRECAERLRPALAGWHAARPADVAALTPSIGSVGVGMIVLIALADARRRLGVARVLFCAPLWAAAGREPARLVLASVWGGWCAART